MRVKALGYCIVLLPLLIHGCKEGNESGFESLDEEVEYIMGTYTRMGAVLGIIDESGQTRTWYYGRISRHREVPPDEHSLFEIGSVTKTFTSLLLAHGVVSGTVTLDEPLQDLLPDGEVVVPAWEDTPVRLVHLATHSSGIPRVPRDSNMPLPEGYDGENPYAAYTTPYMYDYLTNWCELEFEPGTGYLYSNTGGGLLGHALGLRDGSSYRELLSHVILQPLGMNETWIDPGEEALADLAPGYDQTLDSVANYMANDIFQGAGFIKSSLHDMLIYLRANMGLIDGVDSEAFDLAHQEHYEVGQVTYGDREGTFDLSIGLGWHIHTLADGSSYCYHGGRTNGYMAYISFERERPLGFVVMFNHSVPNTINQIGEDLRNAILKHEDEL